MSHSAVPEPIPQVHQDAIRILIDGETTWDQCLIRASHWLNPILVKETRQALKSKQFLWTFTLLIVFTIGWTLLAVLSSIPNVYYDSDGSIFLVGYLIILLLPSIIVIPQTAFRSMSAELEDGTFETLSLSMLSAGQVVYGKLSVAALQLIVYLSILAPCIALTYLLRGVTLEVVALLLVMISVVCMFLSALAIFMAAASRTRTVQIMFSVLLILLQLVGAIAMLTFITFMVSQQSLDLLGWKIFALSCLILLVYTWLWLRCAASLIDLASANRATPVRIAVFVVGLAIALSGAWILTTESYVGSERGAFARLWIFWCWVHWGIAGAWMMGESGIITQRARRALPDSYFGRLFFTWFNPGAGPAYLLVILGFLGPWLGYFLVNDVLSMATGGATTGIQVDYGVWNFASSLAAYLALYLGLTRLFLLIFYRHSRAPRLLLSIAITGALVILAIFVSFAVNLVLNEYNNSFDWYCFINPIWTLEEMSSDFNSTNTGVVLFFGSSELFLAWLALMLSASLVFLVNVLLVARDVMITRIETPPRVLAESNLQKQSEETDPWQDR